MKRPRLEMALKNLGPGDWERFEKFSSEFLAVEYDNLRTVASPSGDDGRDAELFSPTDDTSVVIQYSVTVSWETKIKSTVKRINATIPTAVYLIYVTNQVIGSDGDKLKKEIKKDFKIYLDIRDRNYFLERFIGDSRREAIAESIAEDIVDPILSSAKIIEKRATELSSTEARAAFVYLGLQWRDDEREKGLTKLSFEALVRSVLRDTNSEKRLKREEIKAQVRGILKNHPPDMVDNYTDSALGRLTKNAIRHWKQEDEFCLSHQEIIKLKDYLVEIELADSNLIKEVEVLTERILKVKEITDISANDVSIRARRILEKFLFTRSEAFATAINSGNINYISYDDLIDIIVDDLSKNPPDKKTGSILPDILSITIRDILTSSSNDIQIYLRSLSDSYTLMAYLKETPDVQSAVEKMFSHGEIWLDTTIILPLIAEDLVPEEQRRFQKMINAANEAGLKLKIIPGVIEEVERHMNKSITCIRAQSGKWEGYIPYILSVYIESGQPLSLYLKWLENYRGNARPIDDIADYLEQQWKIQLYSLEEDANSAPDELRYAIKEIWLENHHRRRRKSEIDEISLLRLVTHDVESYVGVLQKRKQEKSSPFGYSAWWLTLDRTAFDICKELERHSLKISSSPVISADFFVNYLAFGPLRRKVSKSTEHSLPTIIDAGLVRYLTTELIDEAEKIRTEMADMPDHVVKRRIRDNLDAAKRRLGHISRSGLELPGNGSKIS